MIKPNNAMARVDRRLQHLFVSDMQNATYSVIGN